MSNNSMPSFFADFSQQRRELCLRLSAFTERLPFRLSQTVLRFAEQLGCGQEDLAWNSVYFFVPLWMQRDLGRSIGPACLDVTYANACMTYAILIQDEQMDEAVSDRGAGAMAANAFMLEAYITYGSLFLHDSRFWPRFTSLMQQSWDHLLLEQRKRSSPLDALTDQEHAVQKAKVNWMKAAAVAVALLADRPDAASIVCNHLDSWQLACQGIDDLVDWRDDLRAENYTRFLVLAGAIGSDGEVRVHEFLGSGRVADYLETILLDYREAQSNCLNPHGYLFQHIAELIERHVKLCQRYDAFAKLNVPPDGQTPEPGFHISAMPVTGARHRAADC
jgi:hypothetical protein